MESEIPQVGSLRLVNFRSFTKQTVEFGNLTALIGPNAAGKSNLIAALKFFSDLVKHGLEDAVSMQGGVDHLRNVQLPKFQPIQLGFDMIWPDAMSLSYLVWIASKNAPARPLMRNLTTQYDIVLTGVQRTRRPRLFSEVLNLDFELAVDQMGKKSRKSEHKWHKANLRFRNLAGKASSQLTTKAPGATLAPYFRVESSPLGRRGEPLIRQRFIEEIDPISALSRVPFFDIDPKLGKSALPVTGRAELEADGDNLPSALRAILNAPDNRARLISLISDALPFIRQVDVASFSDMTRFLQVRESYHGRSLIPGYLLSDGTIDVITFIIALYFQSSFLTCFEEPAKSLHPALIRKIGNMLLDQSRQRQVIITTHSADLIDALPLESIQCVVRDERGRSVVFRPSKSPRYTAFLKTMGLGRLNSDALLSAP